MQKQSLRRWWPISLVALALLVAVWGELSPTHPTPLRPFEVQWPGAGGWTAIFTALLTISTIGLYLANRGLLKAAIAQSKDTEKSANAMTSVAASMAENVKRLEETVEINRAIAERQKALGEMQLRAYVSVIVGGAAYQERDKNIKFAANPLVLNSGATAARKVAHEIRAAILPNPLPAGFVFPDVTPAKSEEGMIPPHQNRTITGIVEDFYPDADIGDIKSGKGRALYTWGHVAYEDSFGNQQRTEFCHVIFFLAPDNRVFVQYIPNRNTAT